MATDARTTITPQLAIGVFLTLMGLVLLLDNLGLVQASDLRTLWPAALIALGVAMRLQRKDPSGRFWGTLWIVVGTWMLLTALGVLTISLGQVIGPLILILIGAAVLRHTFRAQPSARGRERRAERARARDERRYGWDPESRRGPEYWPPTPASAPFTGGSASPPPVPGPGEPGAPGASAPYLAPAAADGMSNGPSPGSWTSPPPPPPAGVMTPPRIPVQSDGSGFVSLFTILGEAKRASNDRPLRGAEMTAFMGGCVLDLRQATIAPGDTVVINVLAVMAGHEVWVPPDWNVASEIIPILGGVDDKRLPPVQVLPADAPLLRIKGVVLMAGLVIKN